ncbi:MAG: hypothetical protein A2270_03720 [Elusimicrobia bacterium RIFOXYA12_FULL_51_18]|nr:MAG: hypothetical protein A2270_03720 [Elusimicrobia bacterium RIFOXYA12_FULL_51_18]OGS31951.1 MAG: hypothetical protein A2218_06685 [Elusimicrobia bacterium RIFOXYA2_FULL_53_38]
MKDQFDESSLNEQAINDVETARLALRWALDKIRALQEETLRAKQNLQEKSAQTSFLEGQLKGKNSELEKILHSHEEEIKSKQDSLEYQFRSKLERLSEREKELEDKISKQEEIHKQKENKLLDDYQRKSDELRARWAEVEAELWKLRQEQMTKQAEFEKLYAAKLDDERRKSAAETEAARAGFERTYADRLSDLEKRESSIKDELKKQEAVLKWAKDSFQRETDEREKNLKQKDLDIEKKLMEKNQEIEDYKVKAGLLQKQISDLPEAVRKRDEDLNRYKQAMESLECVIRTLESEKRSFQADSEQKISRLNEKLEAEKNRYREMEAEIPKRLKIAIEHERGRLAEKLSETETGYKEDLRKRAEEIEFLEKNLKIFEENGRTFQTERDALAHKVELLQTQYGIRQDEFTFREKQLQSEYDVRLKVEIEKHTSALRNEIDTAQRIYEDNLRIKVEEIAHLRRELEGAVTEKMALQERTADLRRAADAVKEKSENDILAMRLQLKADFEKQLSEDLGEAFRRSAAEKQKMSVAFDAQLNDAHFETIHKDDELQKLRTVIVRLEEEKKFAIAEERQRGKVELQVQASSFADTVKIYEDKILQLSKAAEKLKIEREEAILFERERLERLYSEKEKDLDERLLRKEQEMSRLKNDLDERLAHKDQETARLREELIKVDNEKTNAGTLFANESELHNGRIRVLNEKLLAKDADAQRKLEEAVKRESERAEDLASKKNQEISALQSAKESQEDAYRKSLEDFRAKLSEAVGKLETLRKTADERGGRLEALQMELAQTQKFYSEENTALSARLAGKEKDWRDIKTEYEKLKAVSEETAKGVQRQGNDYLLRLKNSEEQRVSKDRILETMKREMEFWKSEAAKKDEEMNSLKGNYSKELEMERKDGRLSYEKAVAESSAREKAATRELMALKDALNQREMEADRFKSQAEELEKMFSRLKEQNRRQAESNSASAAGFEERIAHLEAENNGFRKLSQEYEQARIVIEQLKEKLKSSHSK